MSTSTVAEAVTAVAGACILFTLWLIRRWHLAFIDASRESALAYGTVTLDSGQQFDVSALRLREGGFEFTFGFSGAMKAGLQTATVRGADGIPVARVEIDFPRRLRFDPMLFCTGTFRVDPENLLTEQ